MKQDTQNGMKRVSVNVNQMKVFVIINNIGMMINPGVNEKNLLTEVYVLMDLFGILVIVNANAINHVMLGNIQTMKIVSGGKYQLIN